MVCCDNCKQWYHAEYIKESIFDEKNGIAMYAVVISFITMYKIPCTYVYQGCSQEFQKGVSNNNEYQVVV